MEIIINTHSSILLKGERCVYFDPWQLSADSPEADVIFLTHDHYDHYSPDDIRGIMTERTVVIAPEAMEKAVLQETGIKKSNFAGVVPGKGYHVAGIRFETVPAYNPSKQFHPKEKLYCGYAAELEGEIYYIMGDTDSVKEAEDVKCDVLLLPIGGKYTMNAEEAAALTCRISPKTVIPTHYGSIVGTSEDGERFKKLVQEKAPSVKIDLVLR